MARQTLSQTLLRELVVPAGLMPILGETTRPEMLIEHMAQERRVVGSQLRNIETLMACIAAYFEDYTAGTLSKEALIKELSLTIHAMAREMLYDEVATFARD